MSETADTQTDLGDWTAGTTTESITRTVRLKLETSDRKLAHVQTAIDDWQRVAGYTADLLPSFPAYRWGSRDTHLRRRVRESVDDLEIYAHDRDAAVAKVREAFASWHERGQPGATPTGEFGSGDYLRMSTSSSSKKRREIAPNDRGYGLRVSLLKGADDCWFHVVSGSYQDEFLRAVVDGEADLGVVELRRDGDSLFAHCSVSEDVQVYVPADVQTTVGVDIGERTLWAAAVTGTDGAVETAEIESGDEFRHYREQFDRRREKLSERGDLRGVRKTRHDRERYTEQVCHTASRRIVDLAVEHAPSVLRLEDLTHYRETADDPIHDWPFAQIQEQVAYKAEAAGVPVQFVDPARTSTTCRQCGQYTPEYRDGDEWHCRRCGYRVHADVNAAINLAEREP